MEVKVVKTGPGMGIGDMISKAMGDGEGESPKGGTIRLEGDACIDGKVGEEVTLTVKATFKSDMAGDKGMPRSQSFDIVEVTGRKRCRCGDKKCSCEDGKCTCGKGDDCSEAKVGGKMQHLSSRGRVI